MRRDARRARLLPAGRGRRAGGAAAGRPGVRAAAGAGLGFAKPLGLLLVTWAVWMAASVTPRRTGRATVIGACALLAIAGAGRGARAGGRRRAGGGWWARRRAEWRRARCRRGSGAPAVARVGGRVRGDLRGDGAAGRLLARRVGDREADGHGVRERRERLALVPAARPVDGGRGPQLLLPRPPRDGDRDQGGRDAARRGLQPRAGAARGAVGDRRVHVRGDAVGGRAAAAARACAAARCWSAWRRW